MKPHTIHHDQTRNPGEVFPDRGPWRPIQRQAAEALWNELETMKSSVGELPKEAENLWIVGEHSNHPVGVALLKDRRLALCLMPNAALSIPRLPKIGFAAGPHSLHYSTGIISGKKVNPVICSEALVKEMPERLRQLFLHLATKPEPRANRLAHYEKNREGLSIKSAETIAEKAFKLAFKAGMSTDKIGFADQWASAALRFVMGEQADFSLLTRPGADQMLLLRDRNIHRNRSDLVAKGRRIEERLAAEQNVTQEIEALERPDDQPHLEARRASIKAFQSAHERALNGQAENLKPFSQRFIKGLILAEVTGARLPIGTLSDTISTRLAGYYGEALLFMQDTEIIATGRMIPELTDHDEPFKACGIYATRDLSGIVLPQPRIVLRADVVMIDPRTIYHEFQHARQNSAAEEPLGDFHLTGRYETEVTEWKAKQAEADFTNDFGILY